MSYDIFLAYPAKKPSFMAIMNLKRLSGFLVASFVAGAIAPVVPPYLPEGDKICRPTDPSRTSYEVIGSINRQRIALTALISEPVGGIREAAVYVFRPGAPSYMTTMTINRSKETCALVNPAWPQYPEVYSLGEPPLKIW